MQKNTRRPQNSSPGSFDIKRYLKLLQENVVKILIVAGIFYLLWIFLFPVLYKYAPDYTTKSIVRFDDPRIKNVTSGVTEFASLGAAGKVAILKTNSFLGKVADSLKLNLMLNNAKINRLKLLSDVRIGKDAKYGSYKIEFSKSVKVFYSNKKDKIDKKKVFQKEDFGNGPVAFNYSGLSFKLNVDERNKEDDITLHLVPVKIIVNKMRENLKTKLDLSKTILEISFSDKNAEYAAMVNNVMIDMFVKQLLEYKRHKTSKVLEALDGQLEKGKLALANSEEALKSFRENNPRVTISAVNDKTVSNLIANEKELNSLNLDKADIDALIADQSDDPAQEKIQILELVSFLEAKKIIGAKIFADQYKTLLSDNENLLANYSSNHPIVKENEVKIEELELRILDKAKKTLAKIGSQIQLQTTSIQKTRSSLVKLPAKELKLAELIRNRDINEQIVSKILVRYNEAKIADVSVVPDAYIIDYAQAPVLLLSSYIPLLRFGLGLIIGLLLAVIIIIAIDFLSPSIRSVRDIEAALSIPVLTTVPVIGKENETMDETDVGKKINAKLITADYAPSAEGEAFRLLRTKLMLEGHLAEKKSLIITSLNPNEGKSLVSSNLAITIAQQKYTTVLVDCDLRRGVLHNSFASKKSPGLSDLLKNNSEINWGTVSNIIQETHIPNLFLVAAGTPVPNPSELLGSPRMNQTMRVLKHKFGVVLCDTAPMNYTPDAFVLNSFVNNVMLVAKYGETNANKLKEKTKEFSDLQRDLVGLVINASKSVPKHDQYSYSYYQY